MPQLVLFSSKSGSSAHLKTMITVFRKKTTLFLFYPLWTFSDSQVETSKASTWKSTERSLKWVFDRWTHRALCTANWRRREEKFQKKSFGTIATSGRPPFWTSHERMIFRLVILTIFADRKISGLHFDGSITDMQCAVLFWHTEKQLSQNTCRTQYKLVIEDIRITTAKSRMTSLRSPSKYCPVVS